MSGLRTAPAPAAPEELSRPDVRARAGTLGWPLSALALGAYLAVAFAIYLPAWRDPTHILIGNYGDNKFFLWALGWVPHALASGQDPLITTDLNYPAGVNLMWNNSVPLLGLVLSPLMALAGPTVGYNAAVTLGLAVSAWTAYLAILRLGLSRLAALVGGLLYGFSPYMLDHSLGHLPIVVCALPPLTLVLLHELLVRRRWPAWRAGVLLGLLAGAQVLISLELLATTVLFALLGVLLLAVASPRHLTPRELLPRARRLLVGLASALPVAALVAGLPLGVMFLGRQHVPGELREPDVYVSDLASFFVPTSLHWLSPPPLAAMTQTWSGNISESANGYLGLPLILLLAGIVLWHVRSPLVRWAALFGLLAAILSMGPHVHVNGVIHRHAVLPWALVQGLPVFVQILPARLALYSSLAAGILLAVFVDRLGSVRWGWAAGLGWFAVVLALLPLVPAQPTYVTEDRVPAFFAPGGAVSSLPVGSVAFVVPYATDVGTVSPGPAANTAVDAMAWQAHSGYRFKMPTGYVIVPAPGGQPSHGPVPTTTSRAVTAVAQGGPVPAMTPELRRGMADDLERWGVRYVIVGPMSYESGEVELMTKLLNRPPEAVDGVYLWRDVDPTAIRTAA